MIKKNILLSLSLFRILGIWSTGCNQVDGVDALLLSQFVKEPVDGRRVELVVETGNGNNLWPSRRQLARETKDLAHSLESFERQVVAKRENRGQDRSTGNARQDEVCRHLRLGKWW
jgi:hypothetical protein